MDYATLTATGGKKKEQPTSKLQDAVKSTEAIRTWVSC